MTPNTNKIFTFCVIVFVSFVQINASFLPEQLDYLDEDIFATNKSLPIHLTTHTTDTITRNSSSSSSLLIKALANKNISANSRHRTKNLFARKKNVTSPLLQFTTSTATLPKTNLTAPPSPYALVSYLVDQFNHYRNIDILSRMKNCNPNFKLNDICEIYSFDNHSYSLIRELNVEFQTLRHVFDSLVDENLVQKLKSFCPPGQWCLNNITQNDIRIASGVIRKHGQSFCSLHKCTTRLNTQITLCPSLSPKNISTPTVQILPMLCNLYEEQQSWSNDSCMNELVHFFHILYAFWPQLETCYKVIAAGSDDCTLECLTFEALLNRVENQCNGNPLFLSRVSTFAWYRSANLKHVCQHKHLLFKPQLITSVKDALSTSLFWYRLHERPAFIILFILILISIVVSFSLCLFAMSKNDGHSGHRHLDDDYEYTRLHDSTFDLNGNSSTEITNTETISDRTLNRSQFELNNSSHRFSENQRLL